MIQVDDLKFSYKNKPVLKGLSFEVQKGEIFSVLGPNGSGKSTLFKVLSTVLMPESGEVKIADYSLQKDIFQIRKKLGVLFQSPSLDQRLTVTENLNFHGMLLGLGGSLLKERVSTWIERLGLSEKKNEKVLKLSGGQQRRVEIAKSLLSEPEILILDEPSTGLDIQVQNDIWKELNSLSREKGLTILVTTHLMSEAEHADRVCILDGGLIVAMNPPEVLKQEVGADVLMVKTQDPEWLRNEIKSRFFVDSEVLGSDLRIEHDSAHHFITDLVEAFPGRIDAVNFTKPTLEDVFLHRTGRAFSSGDGE